MQPGRRTFTSPAATHDLPLEQNPEIALTLPEGLNVVTLSARWDTYGDATYGFLVEVVADGAHERKS